MDQRARLPRIDDFGVALATARSGPALGALLLDLRHRAGLSMSELETATGMSAQALSAMFAGRVLPAESGFSAYVRACGVPEDGVGPWLAARIAVLAARDPERTREERRPGGGEPLMDRLREELLAEVRVEAARILERAERDARDLMDAALDRALERRGAEDDRLRAENAALRKALDDLRNGRDAEPPPAEETLVEEPGPRVSEELGDLLDGLGEREWLRVPVGVDAAGAVVMLDCGAPHGIVTGPPGTGKSALLRVVVLGLALTHTPEEVNFLLVDGTGAGTFTGMDGLPHVSAAVAPAEDGGHAARLAEALTGELSRRREAGRADEPSPQPDLFVVLDGFARLVALEDELAEALDAVRGQGPELGLHLLLSSPHEEYLETFEGNKVRTRAVPDARLRGGGGEPRAFRAAHASDAFRDGAVERLAGVGAEPFRVWTPPLDEPPRLDELLPPLSVSGEHGLTTDRWDRRGGLVAVAGLVDRPFQHRRDPYWLDLSSAAGHVAVVGAPGSGRSTAIASLVASLALTHTPDEARFYCIDLGRDGPLAPLDGLPHVGGLAGGADPERLRRTVAEIGALLAARREAIESGIDGIDSGDDIDGMDRIWVHRGIRARAADPAEVFLVVDGWDVLAREHPEIAGAAAELLDGGLEHGVHVIASATDWAAVPDAFGTRLELRLDDVQRSRVGARYARAVPERRPGRGLTRDGLHLLTALPAIAPGGDLDALAGEVAKAWPGAPAPPIRTLPTVLTAADLEQPDAGRAVPGVAIGLEADRLDPVHLDFERDPHLMVVGAPGRGKSTLLRQVTAAITSRSAADQVRVVFVDYGRSLLEVADTGHQIGFAASPSGAATVVGEIVSAMRRRLPPPDLTGTGPRRAEWTGAHLFLVVDDYTLVAAQDNPLLPLSELLPRSRDIGLHLVLARDRGDAPQGDAIVRALTGLGTPCLRLADGPDLPPGRGRLTDRHGERLVQTALHGTPRGP